MMQNTAYKLAAYKIIENEHGDLWWEIHTGLGSLKSGKCFINGDILFTKPSDSIGPGFLKGEFLDHLNKLPKWEKTKYYCASYKIYKCISGGRKPNFEEMNSRLHKEAILRKNGSTQKKVAETTPKAARVDKTEHISYRLRRYEIIEKNNGQLLWKSHRGLGSIKKGRCHINGTILFLEPGETKKVSPVKEASVQRLFGLPDWERTKYFCNSYAIHYSRTGAICRRLGEDNELKRDDTKSVVVNNKLLGGGVKIEPIVLKKVITKDKLKTFFNFCKILVILILKLLFGCFQIICKLTRVYVGKWKKFRG
jgi:hypothetical protein